MTSEELLNDENFAEKIDTVIQDELRYDTDSITSDGWDFLENKAPELIAQKCIDEDAEIDELTEEDIQNYLNDIITEYEQTHANIRYHE